jgi:hypothetical protein
MFTHFSIKITILLFLCISYIYAQTEVITVIGGGGSGIKGDGNIDGIGITAAITRPQVITKTINNQLIIGDNYGLKEINPATNSIKTLWKSDSKSTWTDIVVDSNGNIYASGNPEGINNNSKCENIFSAAQIYKFSSTGKLLQIWNNECNSDFQNTIELAVDDEDEVYAISRYNWKGDETQIKRLAENGSLTPIYDLRTSNSSIDGFSDMTYNNGYLYFLANSDTNGAGVYRYNILQQQFEFYINFSSNSTGGTNMSGTDMIFKDNHLAYFIHNNAIFKLFKHGDQLNEAAIVGGTRLGEHYKDEAVHIASDIEVNSGVRGLFLQLNELNSMVQLGEDIYFLDTATYGGARVLKLSFGVNEVSNITVVEFPQNIEKNKYTVFKLLANDSDGFIANCYCNIDDGKGEIGYNTNTGYYGSDFSIYKSATYKKDGEYTFNCTIYDNEGKSVSYKKSFVIGTPIVVPTCKDNEKIVDNTCVEKTCEDDNYNCPISDKVSKIDVSKLYVATFNRAPDAAGLNYWVNDSHLTLEGIAKSFFAQPETQKLYPEGTSNRDFIKSVYLNLFNRLPDDAGWDYWEAELNSHAYSRDAFILVVIGGAKDDENGMDKTILENKNEVGLYFANAGLGNDDFPTEVMHGVTASPKSVDFIKNKIDNNEISIDVWEATYNPYDTIVSPITGRVWLDRNLGASQVCTSYNDELCYGDYYQWGRNSDGHEKATSDITSEDSQTITPNHNFLIVDYTTLDAEGYTPKTHDWLNTDDNGTQRSSSWNPCPTNFRVPTIYELEDENISNALDAFEKLKLPLAGYRNGVIINTFSFEEPFTGVVGGTIFGRYWSDTTHNYTAHLVFSLIEFDEQRHNSYYLKFDEYNANTDKSEERNNAYPIRCIKDNSQTD